MIDVYLKKKFNESRFLKSDFRKKLMLYAKEWDELIKNNLSESMERWLKAGDYYIVRYFLNLSPIEYQLPFGLAEISTMSVEEFLKFKEFAARKYSLLKKRKELYEEYLKFYDLKI